MPMHYFLRSSIVMDLDSNRFSFRYSKQRSRRRPVVSERFYIGPGREFYGNRPDLQRKVRRILPRKRSPSQCP